MPSHQHDWLISFLGCILGNCWEAANEPISQHQFIKFPQL